MPDDKSQTTNQPERDKILFSEGAAFERRRCIRIVRNFTHLGRTSLWPNEIRVRDAIAKEIERGE